MDFHCPPMLRNFGPVRWSLMTRISCPNGGFMFVFGPCLMYLQSIWQTAVFSTLKFGRRAAMICHVVWFVQASLHASSRGPAKAVPQVQSVTSKRSSSPEASAEPPSSGCWFNYLLVWSCIAISSDAAGSYSGPNFHVSIDTPNSAMVAPVPVPAPASKHLPLTMLSIYTHSIAAPVVSIRPHSAPSLTPSQHSQLKVASTRHVKSLVLTPSLTPKSRVLNVRSVHSHIASPSSSIHSAHRRQTASPIIDVAPPPGLIIVPSPSTLRSNTPDHPPAVAVPSLSPHVSGCCKSGMMRLPGSKNCSCIYPIRLQLLILNVSTSFKNWSAEFQQELASQLGLSVAQFELTFFYFDSINELNMSMDIAPLTGISFSYSEAYRINFTLVTHKLHLNKSLFGDYRLLNFTWLEPAALSPAIPISAQGISPAFATHFIPRADVAGVSSSHNKNPSLALLLGISAGVIGTAVLSIIIIWMCYSNQGKKSKSDQIKEEKALQKPVNVVSNDGSFPHLANTRMFAYEELQEATNNFGPANMLGEGGFGRVFKGVLRDGTAVAIKKLSSGGRQGGEEFLVEVEMLSTLHHRNLVKLVGYHRSRDSSQHLLCYEFVSNGSLEAWLHGSLGANHPLDWATRMKIALDAARGLAYLHEDCQPCVIHRDFKASNILLEKDFHAKVADFGLAKQAPQGPRSYVSTRVMGTFGYVAPEYAMTGHLLVKSDVYSYGVVLLELLSARKPVDMSQPSGQENLVTWARPILRDTDRLEELVDPRLDGMYPKEDFVQVCAIASACVAPEASQRPLMGEVVQSLKMVQRTCDVQQNVGRGEFADTLTDTSHMPSWQNTRPVSTAFESDGSSSVFSSGPFSGLSGFDNYNLSRHAVFSEDLQEGR